MDSKDTKNQRVPIEVAAKMLGVNKTSVRQHMKRKLWDIGDAFSPKETGKSVWEYRIYKAKLYKHLGIEPENTEGGSEGRAS